MNSLWDELDAPAEEASASLWDELEAPEEPSVLSKMESMQAPELSGVTDYSTLREPTVSDGTVSTITTGQPETYGGAFNVNVTERVGEVGQGMARGAARPTLGVAYLGEGFYNKLTGSQSAKVDQWIADNEQYIKDKELEGPALAGEIASNILLGGLSVGKSALAIGAREAGIAGTSSIGADRDAVDTGLAMLLGGGLGAGTQAVINKLDKTKATKLYNYMLEHYNLDEATVNSNFTKWRQATGESNSVENKIKSMVDMLGDRGVSIKQSTSSDPVTVMNLNKRVQDTQKAVKDLAASDFNIVNFADDLKASYDDVATKYSEVKDTLSSVPVKAEFETEPWVALDEATTGDVAELRNLIGSDNPQINSKDLVDSMPIINSMIRKSKSRSKHKWTELGKAVDAELANTLTESQYKLWKETNDLYSKMATVRESKLGDLIATARSKSYKGNPKSTPEEVMAKIGKVSGGDDIFENISTLVGADKTQSLEKSIISSALSDNKSWKTVSSNLRNKGFVTPEGKRLQEIVDSFKTTFKTDDATRLLNTSMGHEGASIATTAEGKALVYIINKVANMARKHVPYSSTAKHLRKMDDLADILKTPTGSADLSKTFEKLPQSVKEEIGTDYITKLQELNAQEALKSTSKPIQLGYSKKTPTGDTFIVDGKTIPSEDIPRVMNNLPEGSKASAVRRELAGKIRVQDAQWQMVRDAMKGTDATVDYIHKQYFTPKGVAKNRFEGILKNTRKKLKVDDANHNIKVVKNIITDEAKQLIKYIEKSEGVKLHPKEAEKIIKMKLDDMVKDCK